MPLGDLLGESGLNRLVGIASEARIHLADLGHLGHVSVIRLLRILRLNLDGLLYRLGADERNTSGCCALPGVGATTTTLATPGDRQ